MKLIACAVACLIAVTALAGPIAIVGGTVHTLGPAGTLENATVLIEDGRIHALGPDIAVPDGARTIDASGRAVTPGLFDPYSYLGLVEISLVEETVDREQTGERFTASFDVADAINPNTTLIPVNRIEGVTRAVTAPAPARGGSIITGRGAAIHLGGTPDFLLARGVGMFASLGEQGARLSGGSRAAALRALHEALEDAGDFADHRRAYERRARREYAFSRSDLEALLPVLSGAMPLVVNANRASDIEAAVALAREYGLRLVIAGGAEAWMVAPTLAEAGVPVILNALLNLPERFETLGATLESAARLHEAGVLVAFGDYASHNSRNLRQVAGNAVAYGLPWDEALKAITVNAATIYGQQQQFGTLEVGKEADVVVWSGDPLEVTTLADHVIIRGREIPMVSRQTLLRDRYLKLDGELPPAYVRP